MKITHCLHISLLVADLDKADHFYGEILGLSKVERDLNHAGIWYQIGEFQLHLLLNPQYSTTMLNLEKWGRNPHLALAVDNLGSAIAKLQSHGCPVQMSGSGRPACFTQDPDGNIIEIQQIN